MKIIYSVNAKIPTDKAHGAQIIKMCESFALNGHDVELVVPHRFSRIKADPFEYYGIKKIFSIKKLPCLDFILWGSESFLSVPIMLLQAFSFYFSSLFFALFNRCDIFYTRGRFPHWFMKNYILEAHALPEKIGWFDRRLYEKARAVIVLTNYIKERLVEAGISGDKILVSPDGVDLEIFNLDISKEDARDKLDLSKIKKIILYSGKFKTMGMDKGISDILKSLEKMNDDIVFVAVGGSENDIFYYKKMAEDLGVGGKTNFIGHAKQSHLAVYQKAADALLMPFPNTTHYAYCMSPLKMFEYMASKRPIIATDLPSIREVLSKDNAIIVQPDNPEGLAAGIKDILADKDLAERIAEQAFKDIQGYTWKKRAENIIEFIKKGKR